MGHGLAIRLYSAAENAVGSPPDACVMPVVCDPSYFHIKTKDFIPKLNKKLSFMSVARKSRPSYPKSPRTIQKEFVMPALSYADIVKDLKASNGTLNAMQNGEEIFQSESVYFGLHGGTRFIEGERTQGQHRYVGLCIPKDLETGILHTVVYPDDFTQLSSFLEWHVGSNSGAWDVEKGTLNATIGPNHESVQGSYHVTLKGSNEEVGGNFKISNAS